jgi:hypothetical protein
MKLKDVPQDHGMGGEQSEVCYAVDERGRYVVAPSLGWKPKNVTNAQAWREAEKQALEALDRVRAGKASPLWFHMTRHQMSVGLLASYVGLFRWRVRSHLTPKGYARLSPAHRRRYAELFEVPVEELDRLPETVKLTPEYDVDFD